MSAFENKDYYDANEIFEAAGMFGGRPTMSGGGGGRKIPLGASAGLVHISSGQKDVNTAMKSFGPPIQQTTTTSTPTPLTTTQPITPVIGIGAYPVMPFMGGIGGGGGGDYAPPIDYSQDYSQMADEDTTTEQANEDFDSIAQQMNKDSAFGDDGTKPKSEVPLILGISGGVVGVIAIGLTAYFLLKKKHKK